MNTTLPRRVDVLPAEMDMQGPALDASFALDENTGLRVEAVYRDPQPSAVEAAKAKRQPAAATSRT